MAGCGLARYSGGEGLDVLAAQSRVAGASPLFMTTEVAPACSPPSIETIASVRRSTISPFCSGGEQAGQVPRPPSS